MKKLVVFFIFCLTVFVFVGCSNYTDFLTDLTNYKLTLTYNDEQKTIDGQQYVDYLNTSDNVLDNVMFNLYANAFRENSKASVVSLANEDKAYPNGKSYGNIEIKTVKIENQETNFSVCGEDENILDITLNSELYPNDRVEIYIEYTVKLANINHRLGYGENAINLCNFYPIACVYENGEFVCDLYNSNGDPFYSIISNYEVEFTYPKKFKLATSGTYSLTEQQDTITAKINAPCVRDFAMVISEKFEYKTLTYDERVKINYYYYGDENADDTVLLISEALAFFEEKIGEYPYSEVTVVETNFVHGGMEYPNIVLISDALPDYATYRVCVVHELCHQWWYGVVGNNQFDYGWIDEGLTEFCTIYFFDNNPKYEMTMENAITASTNSYVTFMRVYTDVQGEVDTSMNRALDEFNTEPEYVYNTYVKGMLMFSTIYELVGEKHFNNALNYYYKTNVYKIVTPNEVIKCFCYGSGRNLENLFDSWLSGKVKIVSK